MNRTDHPTYLELFRQAMQNVEGGYDLLAPKFDSTRYKTPEAILEPFFREVSEQIGSVKHGIDICCGTGAASIHLLKLCEEQITALDISQGMLDQCRHKVLRLEPGLETSFMKADALNIPLEGTCDLAVSFGAFGHIPVRDEARFIQQVHKILKPGGHFFFITTEVLPWWSRSFWRKSAFNVVLRLRNLLFRPKFIMYYMTFQLPKVKYQLEKAGFEVAVLDTTRFGENAADISDLTPLKYFKMVKARKI